jgi:hypothetical protein
MDQVQERERWQNYELPVDATPLDELLLHSQKFCVIQFSHAESAIKSSDGNPWIRCIAFCESLDSAYSVARNAYEKGDRMETRIIAAGKCTLVPRYKRVKADLDMMLNDQLKANAQYDAHVQKRKLALATPLEPAAAEPEIEIGEVKAEPVTESSPTTTIDSDFGRPDEVFLQRFAAFGLIADPSKDNEPVIIPLFAEQTMEDLAKLVKSVSHNVDLVHVDIHCGRLLEWLPLHKPRAEQTIHKHPLRQAFEEKIKWIGKSEPLPTTEVS